MGYQSGFRADTFADQTILVTRAKVTLYLCTAKMSTKDLDSKIQVLLCCCSIVSGVDGCDYRPTMTIMRSYVTGITRHSAASEL